MYHIRKYRLAISLAAICLLSLPTIAAADWSTDEHTFSFNYEWDRCPWQYSSTASNVQVTVNSTYYGAWDDDVRMKVTLWRDTWWGTESMGYGMIDPYSYRTLYFGNCPANSSYKVTLEMVRYDYSNAWAVGTVQMKGN